jgi:hypothetical protein
MNRVPVYLLLACSLVCGCAQSYHILFIEQKGDEASLTFPAGTRLSAGAKLRILPAIQSDELYRHGRLRKVLGKAEIVRILDDSRVQIRILEGTVMDGVSAEISD